MRDLLENCKIIELWFNNGWIFESRYKPSYGVYDVLISTAFEKRAMQIDNVPFDDMVQFCSMAQIADAVTTEKVVAQIVDYKERQAATRKVPQTIMAADMLKGTWTTTE